MSGMWKVMAFYCILLIFPGCMEAQWLTKQMEEYDKKQKEEAEARKGLAKEPEFTEKLASLPEGIQFPPVLLKYKVSYDATRQLLICRGVMKEEEKGMLLGLSEDTSYQEAVKKLYLDSLPAGGKAVEIPVVALPAHVAESKAPTEPAGPQVVLKDGNVIKGTLKNEFTFQTEQATLSIKPEDVLSFLGGTLKLKDGTVLQGKILQESLKIHTDYGELEAKTESIASITGES